MLFNPQFFFPSDPRAGPTQSVFSNPSWLFPNTSLAAVATQATPQQYDQEVRTSQFGTLISVPCAQYLFCSNSNNSEINSAKRNFVCLTTKHIRDLVSNQGSPITRCHTTGDYTLLLITFRPLSTNSMHAYMRNADNLQKAFDG